MVIALDLGRMGRQFHLFVAHLAQMSHQEINFAEVVYYWGLLPAVNCFWYPLFEYQLQLYSRGLDTDIFIEQPATIHPPLHFVISIIRRGKENNHQQAPMFCSVLLCFAFWDWGRRVELQHVGKWYWHLWLTSGQLSLLSIHYLLIGQDRRLPYIC